MANEQYAFIDSERIPSREPWQDAAVKLGFAFELDHSLTPLKSSGYLPCKLSGKDGGFEIYFEDSLEVLGNEEEVQEIAHGKRSCVTFRWGSSMLECACVMVASAALAAEFGAVISYAGDEPYETLDQLLEDTRGVVEDVIGAT